MALTLNAAGAQAGAMEVQPYDIDADKQALVAKLAGSEEIENLTAAIDVGDMTSIVTFGSRAAEDISKASDVVLRSMSMSQLDDSSEMMQALANIMAKFNMDELKETSSPLGRLFGGARRQMDRLLEKYHTMGDEVDKIYVQLRLYESEIVKSNQQLEKLFQANVKSFHELEKYIVAGEQGCREIEDYMNERQADMARTGDQSIAFELQTLSAALNMLRQRTHDLKTAEVVALQSIPMIKTIQMNNMSLVNKINAAFIVTLPVFKQALAQAILLKRQQLQSRALSTLEARTNDMLLKNARATSEQAKIAARMSAGPGVRADTLESAWKTIVKGIDDTRALQENARASRERDQEKLEDIRRAWLNRV